MQFPEEIHFPSLQDAPALENAYSIAMQKGGVGKTVTAICVAAAVARAGRTTLLVDMDPQASATIYFKYLLKAPITESMYNLLVEGKPIKPIKLGRYVSLLPAHVDLAAANQLFAALPTTRELPNRVLARALAPYAPHVDYIIIDCPPSLDLLTKNALTAARYVIIPVSTEEMSEDALPNMLNTVQDVRRDLRNGNNPTLEVRCLLPTLHSAREREANSTLARIHEEYGKDYCIYPPVLRKTKYKKAVSQSVDVGALDPELAGYWNKFTATMIFQESQVAP